jgi:hypothetical protein
MPALQERLAQALHGHYRIERELGAGGMGVVFLAQDLALERAVAIKVLRPDRATAVGIERFVREGRVLSKLSHPSIVAVHAADQRDGLAFLIMGLAEGETLAERLDRGRLSPAEGRALARDLLQALAVAHRHGVVHRDVKPANIFVSAAGAQLGDFGVAHVETEPGELTETGARVGTPRYLAPEQAAGAPATPRSDVYAAGLVLLEALSGRRVEPGSPVHPDALQPLPRSLRRAVGRALCWDPARRWADAGEFAAALHPHPRRRMATGGIALLAVSATVWLVARDLLGVPPGAPNSGRADLMLLPCTGSDSILAGALTGLTTSQLEWFHRISVVPAARAGAGALADLHGTCRLTGRDSALALHIELRDSSDQLLHRLRIRGDPSDELAWSEQVADSIVAAVRPALVGQFRDLARYGTRDVAAMSELVAGEDAFHRGDYTNAERHLRAALARAPRFAQARWRLALLRKWTREPSEPDVRRVLELGPDELPPYYRALAEAQLEPDVRTRLLRFEALRVQDSTGEAEFLLLNELFHRGPLVEIPLEATLDRIRAAAERSPYVYRAMADELAWGNIRLGRRDSAQAALEIRHRAALETPPGSESRDRYALLRLVDDARFRPWLARIKAGLLLLQADSATREGLGRQLRVAVTFDTPGIQLQIARALAGSASPAHVRTRAHLAAAVALAMLGRPRAAVARIDSAAEISGDPELRLQAAEWRVLLPAIGMPLPASERDAARHALAGWSHGGEAGSLRARWALAAEGYAGGDLARGDAGGHRFDTLAAAGPGALHLARTAAALRLGAAGDAGGALTASDSILGDDSFNEIVDPFARALLHLGRARWRLALHDTAGAARALHWHENSAFRDWPVGPPQPAEIDAAAGVIARLQRAELANATGDGRRGCRLARRVSEIWRGAEPALDSLRARARAAEASCPD